LTATSLASPSFTVETLTRELHGCVGAAPVHLLDWRFTTPGGGGGAGQRSGQVRGSTRGGQFL
jgi:hypothetical protein